MKYQNIHNKSVLLVIISGLILVSQTIFAQSSSNPEDIPRMADGHPDLQGTWDFRTITPLQRPSSQEGVTVLSDEEAENFQASENVRRDRDNFTDTSTTGDYNQFWYDRGTKLLDDKRTSLITFPENGRIPPTTEAVRAKALVTQQVRLATIGVEARPLSERCIMGFNSGPPMTPSAYNNNVQFVQTEDYFLIHNEMVHNVRVVKMNATEHREIPRKWEGDSIGHWEGDTLVVETNHFLRDTSFRNSSENMHLLERFWLTDSDTLNYEFTLEDSTTWTQPWTARFPMRRADLPIYEYACHEGNYSLAGVLGGWRRLEKIAAEEAADQNR